MINTAMKSTAFLLLCPCSCLYSEASEELPEHSSSVLSYFHFLPSPGIFLSFFSIPLLSPLSKNVSPCASSPHSGTLFKFQKELSLLPFSPKFCFSFGLETSSCCPTCFIIKVISQSRALRVSMKSIFSAPSSPRGRNPGSS